MTENEIGKVIVDAAIEVHRTLGGLWSQSAPQVSSGLCLGE